MGSSKRKMGSNTELANSILNKLKESNGSMETLELARSLGRRSRKDVNPTLYRMQKNGLILKVSASPPKWGLKHEVTVGPLHGATAEDGDNQQEAEETGEEALSGGSGGIDREDVGETEVMEEGSGGDVPAAEPLGRPINHSTPIDAGRLFPPNHSGYNGTHPLPGVDPMPSPTNNSSSSDDSETAEQPVMFAKPPPPPHELQQSFSKPYTPNGMDHRLLVALNEKVESIHSNDLAKQLGYRTKKEINPTLFSMQKKGLVRKVCESPPMWVITQYGRQILETDQQQQQSAEQAQPKPSQFPGMVSPPVPGIAPQMVNMGPQMEQFQGTPGHPFPHIPQSPQPLLNTNDDRQSIHNERVNLQAAINAGIPPEFATLMFASADMEMKVLCALSNQQTQGTLEIVHNVGLNRGKAKDVNPSLYGLAKRGYITKVTDSPPTWHINEKGVDLITKEKKPMEMNGATKPMEIPNHVNLVTGAPGVLMSQPMGAPNHQSGMLPPDPRSLLQSWDQGRQGPGFIPVSSFTPTIPTQVAPIRATTMPYMPPNSFANQVNSTPIPASPAPQPQSSHNAPAIGSSTGQAINNEMFAAINKNPVSALTEYAQARHLPVSIDLLQQSGPPHNPRFVFAACVGGRRFQHVTSRSKKDGRREAADMALRTLVAEGSLQPKLTPMPVVSTSSNGETTFFDRIAALSHQTFNSLAASIPDSISGRKVLAALIMKRGEEDEGTVISLGTGNRCVTGDKLSMEGRTVNDSHAEIITRRAFLRYLYNQLQTYAKTPNETILTQGSNGKLRLLPEVTLHLYISTAPCGDGAQFSRTDAGENEEGPEGIDFCGFAKHLPTFGKTSQGLLRTKMEQGEGTIPVNTRESVQTWDGIMRGERLRTMSCSDKVASWNLLGLQGALLSHFIEPIYLSSISLGSLYHHGHLARAVCCRVSSAHDNFTPTELDNLSLPAEYHVNHPQLGCVRAIDPPRGTEKTKSLSINWYKGCEKPEVTDGTKGRIQGVLHSQLCKAEMFSEYQQTCRLFDRCDLLEARTYHDAKLSAESYHSAKKYLKCILNQANYGSWMEKPIEEELFAN
ncbi:double-stranded RNA-specific adenosine deaminase-like [Lytechinus variegatus]|uniref:double-stranded RNA-specific adenosine deaminase-like n=1 Tax=Lytechinus variegatus TaxID=7654 RepID=UPI001BB230A0|nr:double-stranded RNA-specific adenosine deaminase-like [Lytechinus variegatus]XP_041467155.1 double-stranded RNA-specific adenosine deaminase-like [Lytechinus variegatus]